MLPSWSPKVPLWPKGLCLLLDKKREEPPSDISLSTILEKSESFPRKFPIDSVRCKVLKDHVSEGELERNVNSTYPIVHESALHLFARYINNKILHGNSIEKEVYKDMGVPEFVDRLLTKRAVSFFGARDNYSLLNGKKGYLSWITIGTPREKEPLVLSKCLSYEEVKLSAFLSVSSYTYFINVGDRKNSAIMSKERNRIENEGIIMGIIGPRLVKENVMDYQEIVISEAQNTNSNGYGQVEPHTIHHLFAEFYDEPCMDFKEFTEYKNKLPKNTQRYTTVKNGEIFDNFIYYKRLTITLDTLFLEANQRAKEKGTTAYVHVVGIGLGVWKRSAHQNKVFMDACAQRIKALQNCLYNIGDICFSYMNHNSCGSYKHGDTVPIEGHPLKGIKIHICKREPHEKLEGTDAGKLLVVSYAWDGNALPGNEFWTGRLGSSGDSATASSTEVSELHNPFINPKVCAANLRVVTEGRVVTLNEYRGSLKLKTCIRP